MCFNVYYGNKDDHSKNFAFLFNEETWGYQLSPAYDLTQTSDKFEHEMKVNRAGNPNDDDLLTLAKEFRLSLSECRKIINNCIEISFEKNRETSGVCSAFFFTFYVNSYL